MDRVELCGVGLHSGVTASVTLARTHGSTSLVQRGVSAYMHQLHVTRTDFGVSVANHDASLHVDLVEHFFAALSVLSAHEGIQAHIDGPEFPLLGGGAAEWLTALETLGCEPLAPRSRIAKPARLEYGASTYELAPGQAVRLAVSVEFGGRLGVQSAVFDGDLTHFRQTIAGARTFGFMRDAERLRGAGRAAHVDAKSVLVFDDGGALALPAPPPFDNELGAHKLLDLVGDSFLYGGLPQGTLRAHRPGHGANHAMFAEARATGVIVDL
ncbi:MAG TPA: UDP-3-O-acyl-N-acetylglucosamine deacetylase [Polyangiaceae bacterium]